MHILLTDVLACPRCGPAFGLILVPDEVHERRVASGILACANCRERYLIDDGVADLRGGSEGRSGDERAHEVREPDEDGALRLAALMGVSEGPAIVLIAGPASERAAEIAGMVTELEVIAAERADVRSGRGVSAVRVGDALPVVSGKLRGVALTGWAADRFLEEGARAVAPTARLVLDPSPADAEVRLEAAGLRTLAREGATIVAARLR